MSVYVFMRCAMYVSAHSFCMVFGIASSGVIGTSLVRESVRACRLVVYWSSTSPIVVLNEVI
jgi:hypothetical protein